MLLVLASAVILRSESRETDDHLLLSNMAGQVPVFISPSNSGPVIPPGTGFFFVASYDSQGYGGSIRPCPRSGLTWFSSKRQLMQGVNKYALQRSVVDRWVHCDHNLFIHPWPETLCLLVGASEM
jgi:hypothetical protein